jgi:hypothetical protein
MAKRTAVDPRESSSAPQAAEGTHPDFPGFVNCAKLESLSG